jgi:hypothetical protein
MLCVASSHATEATLDEVVPTRDGTLLTCLVRTSSLPDGRLRTSLESGLPAAIEMALDVLDDRDHVVGGNRVSLRVAFDLWERIFHVQGPGDELRFPSIEGLQGYLGAIPRLPVSPIGALDASKRHRIRVGLRLHAVAPRESERLSDWMAGEDDRERATDGSDGREVSVSLGRVIRFFYRGARRADADELERLSAWFVPTDLPEDDDDAH